MSLALNPIPACAAPELSDTALVQPDNKWAIHALIQSLLCGEDTTTEETPEQWRDRVERMAADLETALYTRG